ncbi:MAG: hypothetical protein JO273_06260 [Methylobacteriaceae bacterium]|nr:hypothetical protein [Methylobacteriaceae bacterium]
MKGATQSGLSGARETGARVRTVSALYGGRSDAERTVETLAENGIARERIRMLPGYEHDTGEEPAPERPPFDPTQSKGFLAVLGEMFPAEEDRHFYAEGLKRGGFLVSVETTEADHERVVDILDREGTIDVDEFDQVNPSLTTGRH